MKKGATTWLERFLSRFGIIALRNEKGSYNAHTIVLNPEMIIALRNEKGSYNTFRVIQAVIQIIALRNEKGSYNAKKD